LSFAFSSKLRQFRKSMSAWAIANAWPASDDPALTVAKFVAPP
jgi:hypothetical protein